MHPFPPGRTPFNQRAALIEGNLPTSEVRKSIGHFPGAPGNSLPT
jgi:hypothetical protein